jgi:hypothetical protein
VVLDGMDLNELKKYASIFSNYKVQSVWSPPEVLEANTKKELTTAGDIYSFGVLAWETMHNKVPYNGDL